MEKINKVIKIGNFEVSKVSPCFVIGEAGVNHNGDLEMAKKLIDVAVEAKVDAVKFQTFKTEKLSTKRAPKSSYHLRNTPSDEDQSWFELLKSQEITLEMHQELIKYCEQKGIMFLSTPYDRPSADLLESLNISAYKIASTDANNYPLLKYIAAKQIPMILSTAMCTEEEVEKAVNAILSTGNKNLIVLHCTANYPAAIENTNLLAMKTIEAKFDCLVGYSDHCPLRYNPISAVALGAKVIEKHFTLSKHLPGPDHQASLDADELKQLMIDIRSVEQSLGTGVKAPLEVELENRKKLRKSLVINEAVKSGEVLTEANLEIKRPGTGLEPELYEEYLGKKVNRDLNEDHILAKEDLTF